MKIRSISLTFLYIHTNCWADWTLSLRSTAPEVTDGVLDHVGPRHLKIMRTKGNKKK